MEIIRYTSNLLSSNMYVIKENNEAIVIDPFQDTTAVKGLNVRKIILTHEHYDHISGVNVWKGITNAPVLCSASCADNIQSPKKNFAGMFEVFCELQNWMKLDEIPVIDIKFSCHADEIFNDVMSFRWHEHIFILFEIPGHSAGSIGILLDNKFFFSGDSLFENQDVELRLPGGNKSKWNEISTSRLALLPNGILVFPGHFRDFTYNMTKRGDE